MIEIISLRDWAKKIPLPPALFEPLATLRVDWKQIATQFATRFDLTNFSFQPSSPQWRAMDELQKGAGESPLLLGLEISPLVGSLFWLMSRQDAKIWTSWLWKQDPPLSSEILQEGFYRYTALECLDALHSLAPFKQYSFHLNDRVTLPEEGATVVDLTIHCDKDSAQGRLIFSQELYKQLATSAPQWITLPQARSLELYCTIITNQISFSANELSTIGIGDFIPLKRNHSFLYVEETPLFKVRIQEKKMEILDYATIMKAESGEPLLSSLNDLPLTVSVELAKLRIPLEQLMQLSPGKTLDLPLSTPSIVSLSVHGQKIGSAELVSLGNAFGLRIIEISSSAQ